MSDRDARLASLRDGQVRLGPRTVHLDISNGCNTDCITCWDHSPFLRGGRPGAWKRQRADAGFLAALLDDVAALGGLRAVILSGMGEPFTHPEVYRIIADVKRRGLHLTIITNLLAADAERIIALDVDQLLIGIHGAHASSYLAFHPSFDAGDWQRLQTMLARFAAAGRRYKHVHVICAVNASDLPDMITQAQRFGAAQVNFKLASLGDGTERVAIDAQQRRWLLETGVPAARARAAALGVAHNLDVFVDQLHAGGPRTAAIDRIGCFVGYEYTRITVDGTVLYCCNTEVEVGRLAQASDFSALWRGPIWQGLRARLGAGDYFAGCFQCGKLNENVKLAAAYRAAYPDGARFAHANPRRLRVLG